MTTILVLDANQRSALAVTRALGARGHRVLTADCTLAALAGQSRYCAVYLQSPDPAVAGQSFLDWLRQTCDAERVDFVFPVTEISSQLLLANLEQLPGMKIPFAPLDKVLMLADKGELVQLAQSLDIAVPATRAFASGALIDAADIDAWPVVLKPTMSRRWLGDRWLNGTVHIVASAEQLQALLAQHDYLRDHPVLLQDYVAGSGGGVFALYDRGREVAIFAHRRLREKPPWGGVSVLSESAAVTPSMYAAAKQLLDHVGWHGVAMVEFRVDPEGKPWLMEVNTRFWGSLQLAIDAGVDFPGLLLDVVCGRAPQPVASYTVGRRLRWLLGDLDSLYIYLRSANYSAGQKLIRTLHFFNPFTRWARHEVNRWNDPGPAWLELKQYFRALRGGG